MNRRREGKDVVKTWHRMKQLLKARFLPADYDQILYQQYHQCSQKGQTVNEYSKEFLRLSSRNNLQETERQQVVRYISGLSLPIQEKLELSPLWNLNDTVNLANRVERQIGKQHPKPHTKWKLLSDFYFEKTHLIQPNSTSFSKHPYSKPPHEPLPKAAGKLPMAPIKPPNPYAKSYPLKCFKCNQIGHIT